LPDTFDTRKQWPNCPTISVSVEVSAEDLLSGFEMGCNGGYPSGAGGMAEIYVNQPVEGAFIS
uniref:Cathepsin B-like cysteine proteinase (Fragments) n=1 Tax=Gallus gallus TaxID=9031 RepID=Q7LZP6_CHICK